MGQACSVGCCVNEKRVQLRPRSQSNTPKGNQLYYLNHVECRPYQARRSRYSLSSASFLALVTKKNSSIRRISPQHSSMAESRRTYRQVHSTRALRTNSMASSNPALHRDPAMVTDPPIHQRSMSDLQRAISCIEYRRKSVNRQYRSAADVQAVRKSYLLAVSHESFFDSADQQQAYATQSLSMEVFLSLPFHLVAFLFNAVPPSHEKRVSLHIDKVWGTAYHMCCVVWVIFVSTIGTYLICSHVHLK